MDADLQKLLSAWLTGDVDDTALAPPLERLRTDETFRRAFVAEISLLGQLKAVQSSEPRWLELEDLIGAPIGSLANESDFESRVMDGIANEPRVRTSMSGNMFQPIVLAAGAVAALLLVTVFYWQNQHSVPAEPVPNQIATRVDTTRNTESVLSEDSVGAVAVLSQSVDAKWHGSTRPVIGDPLAVGDLRLLAGTVQIEFLSGVRLLLRGPAEVELRAADEMVLREGSASCFVTEMGRGFRIITKDMDVIDVGTAFSIDVGSDRPPEVHVLEGSVEIVAPQTDMLALNEHQAIRMTAVGPERVAYSPNRFPQPADLRRQQLESGKRRYERWQQQARDLTDDPAVLLHYTFEDSDPGSLEVRNIATDGDDVTDGVIIGCDWTAGRWASKRAILYRNAGDRVLFQVPGAYQALTLLVWARVDALTQQTTSLLMTESPLRRARFAPAGNRMIEQALRRRSTSNVQTVRWELTQQQTNSAFNVGYGSNVPKNWTYHTSVAPNSAIHPNNWGQWSCFAVTANVKTGDIVHYVNGVRTGTGNLTNTSALLLDFMELGNFGASADEIRRSSGRSQRRFYGAIDEVLIANRVFDDSEIESIWMSGKP
ncbi:iron dicitrate transport regulator FecR [Stieleria sp. TO1_6]|uniref:LamG-like jellyroll fold domain-containing protein n=1 Tax=Stieleria tagensis TaxID=2956795 RepID=UPI00209A7490|nr:LamG-like jellyroll fold domain-containing protein [Stieleria tagensis]MCO8120638.1 iron dicitrate transport regulator FecR [Stieleria tagensis]